MILRFSMSSNLLVLTRGAAFSLGKIYILYSLCLVPNFPDRLCFGSSAVVPLQDAQRCGSISVYLPLALSIVRDRRCEGVFLLCHLTDRVTEAEHDKRPTRFPSI